MQNKLKKLIPALVCLLIFSYSMPIYTSAYYVETQEKKIDTLLEDIFQEREQGNEALDKVNELESILASLNVDSNIIESSTGASARAFGQWVDLGKGWKYQVHRPHGSNATKYHVHVKGKVGKNSVEAKEALDGSSTHGSNNTMNDKGVPKDIQKKVKNDKNYKDAKKEHDKAKKAKSQMNSKRLNLRKMSDLIIGIGIFVSTVGIVLFAMNLFGAWMPVLLAL